MFNQLCFAKQLNHGEDVKGNEYLVSRSSNSWTTRCQFWLILTLLIPTATANAVAAPQLTGIAAVVNSRKEEIDEIEITGTQDDLRNYAYEGVDSEAGSLSTINTGKVTKHHHGIAPCSRL